MLKKQDHRNAWKWVKACSKLSNKSEIASSLLDRNTGEITDDPVAKMRIWADHFKSLCIKYTNELPYMQPTIQRGIDEAVYLATDDSITIESVKDALNSTRNYKAA